jgi:hypothetical protein
VDAVKLSIVMPTIAGREEWLERTCKAFYALTETPFELLVEVDHPGCGPAWQAGGARAQGDYIFMAADDLEPKARGWETAAMDACDDNLLPAPLIYYPDGRLQSCGEWWETLEGDNEETAFTRAPFMSRAQWEVAQPMLPTHYWTDNWVSWKCWQQQIPTVVTYGFDLIHHLAGEGRNEERMGSDGEIFARATQGEDVWSTVSAS